jgi:hypothetical protein
VILHKQTQLWTAFLFGVVFVIVLLAMAIFFPNPTAFQYTIFRSVLSLAAAGLAAMIPGFISLSVSNWLRAGGALAVFAVVYFYNPAALISSAPSQTNDIKGDQNQVINGNTGRIVITNDKTTPKGTNSR